MYIYRNVHHARTSWLPLIFGKRCPFWLLWITQAQSVTSSKEAIISISVWAREQFSLCWMKQQQPLSKQSPRSFLLLSSSSETNQHLFVFSLSRSLTIALATRLGTSWLPGHIIGPLLVFKVTQRQASASYIRKRRPSQEWNIWRWEGAAVASRISWRARTWQTGSRRRTAHRCTEWLRIIGPFLPFSATPQDFGPANLIRRCLPLHSCTVFLYVVKLQKSA